LTGRRHFVLALGVSALAAPVGSFAQQQPARLARIGLLAALSASNFASRVESLRAGLREFGYVEGKNIVIEFRSAEAEYDRLPELAVELVRLKVDIIVAAGTPAIRAAKQATETIPIVIAAVGDAVAGGLVASLARSG
jgi:putative ABC transport system substrate-binding protein